MPTKTKTKDEKPQEARKHEVAPEGGLEEVTRAFGMTEEEAEKARRPDSIPEMQARVLSVMDLSQAFGFGVEDMYHAIICAVNETHTPTDVNCWCGKLHPKQRKEATHDDGNGN